MFVIKVWIKIEENKSKSAILYFSLTNFIIIELEIDLEDHFGLIFNKFAYHSIQSVIHLK